MNCPMCGGNVRVRSSDEGTNSYEPIPSPEALDQARAALLLAKSELEIHEAKSGLCGPGAIDEIDRALASLGGPP